ncbi:50S ribosomal protein L6 [Desulfobulbus oligotrophicus]|jgi:large subunit ribosomal protein L6|uniref:Large ribosomal subunit protein uL6 n=1 Tax=Desulfobulbus oligotrophicus TaxID=1909699 RepID=A0A7T5VDF6_9BACT|nr:50S ribosomal protein L6 [Desulfobulbus oligotrophicus]MDY0390377.1 50S ribosomal protein L6 [Desulfobulbus oligotrophicus]QQG65739.1 50S ribosomal protein L6 [Desulfobulbus oligotrophicus]
MSRIGKMPITVPKGVTVEIQGTNIKVTGTKGVLERDVRPEIELELTENQLVCKPKGTSKRVLALWGLTRSLIDNMVTGVSTGFTKKLLVEGVGYRASVQGNTLTLNVGYSSAVNYQLPDGVAAVTEKDNSITLHGIDKELVGLTAAQIRHIRKPEPYKGKGIRYADEYVARKVGKAGGAK